MLLTLDWQESTVAVYNPATASTHLLSGDAADHLAALTQGLCTPDALPLEVRDALHQAGLLPTDNLAPQA